MWGSLSLVSRRFLSRFQLGVLYSVPFWYCSSLLSIGIKPDQKKSEGKRVYLAFRLLPIIEGNRCRNSSKAIDFLLSGTAQVNLPWDVTPLSGLEQLNKCPPQTCLQANWMETIPQLSVSLPRHVLVCVEMTKTSQHRFCLHRNSIRPYVEDWVPKAGSTVDVSPKP